MSIDIEKIKEELNQLCRDYVGILNEMKEKNIINDIIFEECTTNKITFLQQEK
ncbi:MAG: hypothetical protein ACRCXT_04120 [Paraclostridium sp.]